MKKFLFLFFVLFSLKIWSQKGNLKFDKTIWEVENQWVAFHYENDPKDIFHYAYLGFNYWDDGNFFLHNVGTFQMKDEKFIKLDIMSEDGVIPFENIEIAFAILPKKAIKELNLEINENLSVFGGSYENRNDHNFKILRRAHVMTNLGEPKLALLGLKKLHDKGYASDRFFHEMMFAYNKLKLFSEAEKIGKEAKKKGHYTDIVLKEYVFALLRNDKILEGEAELKEHWKMVENLTVKEETLSNLILALEYKREFKKMWHWIEIYHQNFPVYAQSKEKIKAVEARNAKNKK